jgi:DNA-binding NarL/FixJ family response regulator
MERQEVEKTRRVLIADDRPPSGRGLKALLALRPEICVVGEAADGQEAVRLAEALRPHVVLMDVKMSRRDGLEATRFIKERWPQIRIVLLTIDAGYRAGALAAGADAFLVKGCPGEDLLAAVLDQ